MVKYLHTLDLPQSRKDMFGLSFGCVFKWRLLHILLSKNLLFNL